MPAATSPRMASSELVAGPRVATILARRMRGTLPANGYRRADKQLTCSRRNRGRQVGRAHEVLVDGSRGSTPLGDRPDDQRLPAAGIAGNEDAADIDCGTARRDARSPRSVTETPSCSTRPFASGPTKPIARKTKSAGISPAGALPGTESALVRLDVDQLQRPHPTVAVVDEALGRDGEDPLATLLVRARDAVGHRVRRPRLGVGTRLGRSRQDLELRHRGRALTVRGAQAVGAGVAAADDDHVLALRRRWATRPCRPPARGWRAAGTPSPGRRPRGRGRARAGRATWWHPPRPPLRRSDGEGHRR